MAKTTKRIRARSKNYRIRDEVKDMLVQLDTSLLVDEFHAFCINTDRVDRTIHPMEMLDDLLSQYTPWEIICKTQHPSFHMMSEWFCFDEHDHVITLDEVDVRDIIYIWLDDIATWMVTDPDAFGWIHSDWIKNYLEEAKR